MYVFSVNGLMARTRIEIISVFRDCDRHKINLGTKMRLDPKFKDQKCIFAKSILCYYNILITIYYI